MFGIRREQGRLAELAPAVRVLAASDSAAAWRPGLAALMAELGMLQEARRELDRVRVDGLDTLRPALWLASLTYLADVSSVVGDAEMASAGLRRAPAAFREQRDDRPCRRVLRRRRPLPGHARRHVRRPRPRRPAHFEAALALDREAGAHTWIAHTAHEYGRLLRDGGGADDAAGRPSFWPRRPSLRSGSACGRCSSGSERRRGAPAAAPPGLSPREVEILRLVARGLSNREVGRALSISEHTAANHIRSILRKTGCANRTEAAAYAHANGLIAG